MSRRRETLDTACSVNECDRPVDAKGYCSKHYTRWRKHGDPLALKNHNTHESVWSRVNKNGSLMPHMTTPCWEWTGHCNKWGYGQVRWMNVVWLAHRLIYFLHYGTRPVDLVLHECDNPPCCNPSHLKGNYILDSLV